MWEGRERELLRKNKKRRRKKKEKTKEKRKQKTSESSSGFLGEKGLFHQAMKYSSRNQYSLTLLLNFSELLKKKKKENNSNLFCLQRCGPYRTFDANVKLP
eukprot:TRINITY_DN10436_c0_g4_i1.p3 TRINITY_DN10436_c0_g4~~TRINITY_DN10436_c0_g4_i1.p3  ORF type:complete len:101 (-),score=8.85 TRINITY_DN10436_c0_g4_i1:1900-2202(-)